MNIFAISPSPFECARALDDKRLNKMILETAQLLSTAIRLKPELFPNLTEVDQSALYRPTHAGHGVSIWVRESYVNFDWTHALLYELLAEYTFRTEKLHGCGKIIDILGPTIVFQPLKTFCNFARNKSLNLDFTSRPVHEAYKLYLNVRWDNDIREPKWTKRGMPEWRKEWSYEF